MQRCGNSIVDNNPNRRSIGSEESESRRDVQSNGELGSLRNRTDIPQRKSIQKNVPIASTVQRQPVRKPEPKVIKKGQTKEGPKVSEFLHQRYGGEMGPDSQLIEMLER